MLKIGLTGGIGSGKSTVAGVFRIMKVPIFDADLEARKLQDSSDYLITETKKLFGDQAYSDGKLDRKRISSLVFNQPELLKKLSEIVHPVVHSAFSDWAEEHRSSPFVIYESALLFETQFYKHLDGTILVTAPVNIRLNRVMRRDNMTEEEVRSRMNSQLDDDIKNSMSSFIIINDDSNLLLPQILKIQTKINDLK